ncbi:hypothetical protein [uncultured Psychroserpens sp.]|uniref:hypothetical protein n=1 Tax=uncultured Psychroserpens sp. TaxID=255436 RepID=UPI0026359080|nr:hypothetical protein [uncultured Psychroserpens sp.]
MNKPTNVLIVEQEPLVSFSIEEALTIVTKQLSGTQFKSKSYRSYECALAEMSSSKPFGLVFLNINFVHGSYDTTHHVKDLVDAVRRNSPKTHLLTLTSVHDNFIITEMIKTLNPECVLLKKDVSFNELVRAIKDVINCIPFYSQTILKCLRSRMTCDIALDKRDRLILYHLSKGIKTKDLPKLVFLSKSAVESRKRNLKLLFSVEQKPDYFLLEQARLKGFI